MNKLVFTLIGALLVLPVASKAGATPPPAPAAHDVALSINDAFIPSNFDSGSDAFVVISGMLPNGCYHYKTANVNHLDATTHEVQAVASVSAGLCPMVLLFYSRNVQLGKLASGEHTVRFLNGDGTFWEKHLTIE